MKYYKGTNNLKCQNVKFEVGKTYEIVDKLIMCRQGYHFCKEPDNILSYYPFNKDFKLIEIEVLGDIIDEGNKSVTNKMKVLRVVPSTEYNDIFKRCKFDSLGNIIYFENRAGYWEKYEYDESGNMIYFENSNDSCIKYEYDESGNKIYFENLNDSCIKFKYDKSGNMIYNRLGMRIMPLSEKTSSLWGGSKWIK